MAKNWLALTKRELSACETSTDVDMVIEEYCDRVAEAGYEMSEFDFNLGDTVRISDKFGSEKFRGLVGEVISVRAVSTGHWDYLVNTSAGSVYKRASRLEPITVIPSIFEVTEVA